MRILPALLLFSSLMGAADASAARRSTPVTRQVKTTAAKRITPGWMGKTTTLISRDPNAAPVAAETFSFDSWARQRAQLTSMGFEVWAAGATDRNNPDLWKQLDVKIHYRYAGQKAFKSKPVNIVGRDGNNARYELNLRTFDPYEINGQNGGPTPAWAKKLPTTVTPDGRAATMEFYFSANGVTLRRPSGQNFTGSFIQ